VKKGVEWVDGGEDEESFKVGAVLLGIQVIIVITMALLILLQKTGGDSLAGLSGGGGNVMSAKASSDALYKITIFLAIAFFVNSLIISKIYLKDVQSKTSIIDGLEASPSLPLENVEPKAPIAID